MRDEKAGLPGISVRDAHLYADRRSRPWAWRLFVFLRVLSVTELLRGLCYWAKLIGADGRPDPLAGATTLELIARGAFAALDPVACVGLWLGAPWGVVIWLLVMLGEIATASAGSWLAPEYVVGLAVAAIASYVLLAMLARREQL